MPYIKNFILKNKKIIAAIIIIIVFIILSFVIGKGVGKHESYSKYQSKLQEYQGKIQEYQAKLKDLEKKKTVEKKKISNKKKAPKTTQNRENFRPSIISSNNNFVIGYGSLMNKASRRITVPSATKSAPILVKNFERIWASRGTKSHATYLLAVLNHGYVMNAIYYKSSSKGIAATDLREASYRRVEVPRGDITPLGIKVLPKGDYWMYVKDFKDAQLPTRKFPILQSYADVFMTGCLQTQAEFGLTEFGKLCFTTTYNWDLANWVNDRINPQYARYSDNTRKYTNAIDDIIHRITYQDKNIKTTKKT